MKIKNPFSTMSKGEITLWLISVAVVILSYLFSGAGNIISLIASIIGATALIFVSKGHVLGQILTVVFAVFYGIISFSSRYYGEMITYLGMTAPMAVMSIISWVKHPYKDSGEVEINNVTPKQISVMGILSVVVTVVFYFILKALGNASLLISTISVTTSFLASYLTFLRSPFYALAYAANDIVLIILWVLSAIEDISSAPMIICFVIFLVNDLYGFVNWQRMKVRQSK